MSVGYDIKFDRDYAESATFLFVGLLLDTVRDKYPPLFESLQHIKVHGDGVYSKVTDSNPEFLDSIHSMHIELFPLKEHQDLFRHYADYLCTLFYALQDDNFNLPEIRDFFISKTRRNRLFQEFIMIETIANQLWSDLTPLSNRQQQLRNELFKQLRIENRSEFIATVRSTPLPVINIEIKIRDELIFPRAELFRQKLSQSTQNSLFVKSPPYYDGNNTLSAMIPEDAYFFIQKFVRESYDAFPKDFDRYNEGLRKKQSEESRWVNPTTPLT